MANEATLRIETHVPINFTCADGTGIEKGALVKLSSPMTASLSDGNNDIVAGIVQSDKIAGSGIASVSVFRGGVFAVNVNGTVSAGDPVVFNGSNQVKLAVANQENIAGYMLEDATDGQTKLMELRPTTMQLA